MRRLFLPLFFGIVGTAILLKLGFWQVDRLAWKEAELARIDAKIVDAPVAVPTAPTEEGDEYLPVVTTGRTETPELHVLASSKQTGAIYRIVTAFETAEGRRLLLDRGWVKPEAKNAERSPVTATIVGNLLWPNERNKYTPENDVSGNTWFARDIADMSAILNTEPILIVQRDKIDVAPEITPMPVTSTGIPNDHLQYAVTWFGLALVWIGMTLYYLRRMRTREKV
ncbi:SURF1 family protein [Cognatishimia maritima]|uniref:SURF1-like protein n=1 Tax=Cognatishimia maritima TaxID=870908 RepID=A0A1M5VD65_9RHOB|nr:SURF1 family protein [Cognatishimia maritima]SHH73167.1 surfeit locus 1 family protein [Cognatishimia maritima]